MIATYDKFDTFELILLTYHLRDFHRLVLTQRNVDHLDELNT